MLDSLRRCEPDQVQRDSLSLAAELWRGTPVMERILVGSGWVGKWDFHVPVAWFHSIDPLLSIEPGKREIYKIES